MGILAEGYVDTLARVQALLAAEVSAVPPVRAAIVAWVVDSIGSRNCRVRVAFPHDPTTPPSQPLIPVGHQIDRVDTTAGTFEPTSYLERTEADLCAQKAYLLHSNVRNILAQVSEEDLAALGGADDNDNSGGGGGGGGEI